MFIRKVMGTMKENFVFIIRKPDGSEYENVVSANSEAEAKQRLKNILEVFQSQDEIVGLKEIR